VQEIHEFKHRSAAFVKNEDECWQLDKITANAKIYSFYEFRELTIFVNRKGLPWQR